MNGVVHVSGGDSTSSLTDTVAAPSFVGFMTFAMLGGAMAGWPKMIGEVDVKTGRSRLVRLGMDGGATVGESIAGGGGTGRFPNAGSLSAVGSGAALGKTSAGIAVVVISGPWNSVATAGKLGSEGGMNELGKSSGAACWIVSVEGTWVAGSKGGRNEVGKDSGPSTEPARVSVAVEGGGVSIFTSVSGTKVEVCSPNVTWSIGSAGLLAITTTPAGLLLDIALLFAVAFCFFGVVGLRGALAVGFFFASLISCSSFEGTLSLILIFFKLEAIESTSMFFESALAVNGNIGVNEPISVELDSSSEVGVVE